MNSPNTYSKKIAVIIPAYNEEQTIVEVITAFYQELPDSEIWVIDNCSTDQTSTLANGVFDDLDVKGGVLYESKKGKSNACRLAFRRVDADVFVMVDADLTYPADRVHELITPVLEGRADMVVGDRLAAGMYKSGKTRPFHNFGNTLVCSLLSLFFGQKITDAMSGYRAFSREFIKLYPVLQSGFELETEMTIHGVYYGYNLMQIPVSYVDRPEGSESKLNTFKDGARIIKLIVRLLKNNRPTLFFGSLSVLFGLAGLFVGAPVLFEFINTGFILRVPSAILASSMFAISFTLLVAGIVMDTITVFQRFDYEIKRNLFHQDAARQRGTDNENIR